MQGCSGTRPKECSVSHPCDVWPWGSHCGGVQHCWLRLLGHSITRGSGLTHGGPEIAAAQKYRAEVSRVFSEGSVGDAGGPGDSWLHRDMRMFVWAVLT